MTNDGIVCPKKLKKRIAALESSRREQIKKNHLEEYRGGLDDDDSESLEFNREAEKVRDKIMKRKMELSRNASLPNQESIDRINKVKNYYNKRNIFTQATKLNQEDNELEKYINTGIKVRPPKPKTEDYNRMNTAKQLQFKIRELKIAKEHKHSIQFRVARLAEYKPGELKETGKFWKYWLLNAKQTNGNGWGVSNKTIRQNIARFIGRPFVITDKSWVENTEYSTFEHPYLPTNHIPTIFNHQAKFRVGDIVDVFEDKNGDFFASIKPLERFAMRSPPPFCSPAVFQLDPREPENDISKWEALHLAGLDRDPAYGPAVAMLKGTCIGTSHECSIQFKGAKINDSLQMTALAVNEEDVHNFLRKTKTIRLTHIKGKQGNSAHVQIADRMTPAQIKTIKDLGHSADISYTMGEELLDDITQGDGVHNLLRHHSQIFGAKLNPGAFEYISPDTKFKASTLMDEEGNLMRSKFDTDTHYDIARRHGYKRPIPMSPDGDEFVEDEDVHNFIKDHNLIRVQHFPNIQKISLHIPKQLTQSQIRAIRDFEKYDPNVTIGYAIGQHFNNMQFGEGVRNLLMTNAKTFGQKQGGISGINQNTTYQKSKKIKLYRNLFPDGAIKKQ